MSINTKPRDLFKQENNQHIEKTQCSNWANTAYREQSYILVYIQHITEWKYFHILTVS